MVVGAAEGTGRGEEMGGGGAGVSSALAAAQPMPNATTIKSKPSSTRVAGDDGRPCVTSAKYHVLLAAGELAAECASG